MNLCSILACHAQSRPQKIAIRHGSTTLSYLALWQSIENFAACLDQHGVARGNKVGLALKDHIDHVILHYAVARLGAVIVPLDHRWTDAEIRRTADAFATTIVITESDRPLAELATLTRELLHEENDVRSLPRLVETEELPLLISLSSGTTGRPTGALVTHTQMYERFVSQWATIGFNADDRFIALTPLYFGAGRSFAMSFLAAGAELILDPPPHEPQDMIDAINHCNATATFLVPTLLRRLLPLAADATLLLPKLQCLLISGAALYADEAREIMQRISPNLTGYYASSEGGGISVLNSCEFLDHADSVGHATFRTEVGIVDEAGSPSPAGETGRLRYRGPGVARVFIDSDGVVDDGDPAGWFYPGDLATRGDDGLIYLRGRDKDVINRGGVNVYPTEIEATLSAHPDIREVAVIGRAAEGLGEVVIAYLTTATGLDVEQLTEYCRQRLAPYKVPAEFIVIDELPKKASGKIDKQAIRALT